MRTLTDVFAPGTPPLPEGLRTLQVSPGRIVEPGTTVHANFTFRNLGGGTATGFRIRFKLPDGLTYLVGTAQIDDVLIDEQGGLTSLLQGAGAPLGDVPPGGERRVSLAYTVAPTIENGTQIALQAAISSFEVPVIGSNVVRLVVRSRPTLKNAGTRLVLTPVREATPGAELALRVQVHNSGQSSAHDVIVLLPVPAHTSYVPQSARVDGRLREVAGENEPFGVTRPAIVAPTLGPGATIDVGYRVRIDPTLEDGTAIVAQGSVCTHELPEFALSPTTLRIPSSASFAGDETALRVEAEDDVVPGQRVKIVVRARNAGTARARAARVRVKLPDGLVYSAGSRSVDGAPAVDGRGDPGIFELGDIDPGRSVEVALAAIVRSPIASGLELPVEARVEWSKGERTFARTLTVRSAPAFPAAFNTIEREGARRLAPGDAAAFTVRLQNMGADVAADARLLIEADSGLEGLRVSENGAQLPIGDDGAVHLDTLEPNVERTLRIETRVAPTMEDQTQLRLRAVLRTAQLPEIELGSAAHVVASRPRFTPETSRLVVEETEALRPNRTTACRVVVHNEGTDRGRDVRVRLQLPEELRLENVYGASRDGDSVVFGEIPAQATQEATIHVRLLGAIGIGDKLEVGARLTGTNAVPFSLEPLQLETHAEPTFAEGATLTSMPADTVDAGDVVAYVFAVRNSGDGVAKRLNLRMDAPSNAVYAPGSTTVNDVALLDFAGTSPLLTGSGLTLGDVAAGVEVLVRLRAIVNTPLPGGTTIETRAYVVWDDTPEMVVRAHPLRVRSSAALPIVDPMLPFSVLDAAAAPSSNGAQRRLTGETYLELPPAVPVRANGANPLHDAAQPSAIAGVEHPQLGPGIDDELPATAALVLDLPPDRLDWIVRYLDEARGDGLLADLMVLRALFPMRAGTADATEGLRDHAELLSEVVDRIFVKARLPGASPDADDVDSRAYGVSLRALIDVLRSQDDGAAPPGAGLRLVGFVERDALDAAAAMLEREPLVAADAWAVTASLLGTSLQRNGVVLADLTAYRDALRHTFEELRAARGGALTAALRSPAGDELAAERAVLLQALSFERSVTA
ncbi:MAG TPA: hypothetical protein VFB22_00565 [Candidatus Baltobacteraceae bacterium]|nr:hypothetical protein [Candidatus Baltobacteraceae bacterium]